jgi:hypothetical protein
LLVDLADATVAALLMIFDPSTLLILGAGASKPYGFPLGQELKNQIIQITKSSGPLRAQLIEAGFSDQDISEYNTDLVRSIHPTIDAFLEDRPSRREIGAFTIAQILMPLENEENLFPHRDWYPILFKELDFRRPELLPAITAIISLNYERSLEHFCYETIMRTFEGESRETAKKKLAGIPIVHVHGVLGPYPVVPYAAQRTVEDLKAGAKGIRMIHDDLDDAEEFKRAKELVSSASSILFLGFGYDKRTLRRLGVLEGSESSRVYGTAVGLQSDQMAEIREMFRERITLDTQSGIVSSYLSRFYEIKNKHQTK